MYKYHQEFTKHVDTYKELVSDMDQLKEQVLMYKELGAKSADELDMYCKGLKKIYRDIYDLLCKELVECFKDEIQKRVDGYLNVNNLGYDFKIITFEVWDKTKLEACCAYKRLYIDTECKRLHLKSDEFKIDYNCNPTDFTIEEVNKISLYIINKIEERLKHA